MKPQEPGELTRPKKKPAPSYSRSKSATSSEELQPLSFLPRRLLPTHPIQNCCPWTCPEISFLPHWPHYRPFLAMAVCAHERHSDRFSPTSPLIPYQSHSWNQLTDSIMSSVQSQPQWFWVCPRTPMHPFPRGQRWNEEEGVEEKK